MLCFLLNEEVPKLICGLGGERLLQRGIVREKTNCLGHLCMSSVEFRKWFRKQMYLYMYGICFKPFLQSTIHFLLLKSL